jgi:acetolactate synthase regulatory subunit
VDVGRRRIDVQANRAPGALRRIEPPRRRQGEGIETMGMTAALVAARRLEIAARACQAAIAGRDPALVRATLGQAFDALELVEAGLAREFPPRDPGRPA